MSQQRSVVCGIVSSLSPFRISLLLQFSFDETTSAKFSSLQFLTSDLLVSITEHAGLPSLPARPLNYGMQACITIHLEMYS